MHLRPCQHVHLNPQTFLNGSKSFHHDTKCFRIEFTRPHVLIPTNPSLVNNILFKEPRLMRNFSRHSSFITVWLTKHSFVLARPRILEEADVLQLVSVVCVWCEVRPSERRQVLLKTLHQTESRTSCFGVRVGCSR